MTRRWDARLRALEQQAGSGNCPACGWPRRGQPEPTTIRFVPAWEDTPEHCATCGRLLVFTPALGEDDVDLR